MMIATLSKEEFRYRLTRLKEAIDAEQLLRVLGFDISSVNSQEIRCPCKVHGGDNKTAFRMNKETKNWVCFSRSCQEDIGYDVISLVRHMMGFTFMDAVNYLENITGLDIKNDFNYVIYKREKDRSDFIKSTLGHQDVPPALVKEEYLDIFKKKRSRYFESQGYPSEVLDIFEVGGGYVDRYGYQRDVIPIRDINSVLVGYSCRDITGKSSDDYKYILTKDFKKDSHLYNLNNAIKYRGENNNLIVVEGFKSVWKLYMAGYYNVVACMGKSITEGQRNLLYANAFKVTVLLDADMAGIKGTMDAMKNMGNRIVLVPIFIPYDGKDPSDLEIEELQNLLG